MARTKAKPVDLIAPPASMGGPTPFRATDVPILASRARLILLGEVDPQAVADTMNRAIYDAHSADVTVVNAPTPGRTREVFQDVAAKGRELLYALGIKGSILETVETDAASLAKGSGVLRALVRHTHTMSVRLPTDDVIARYQNHCDADDNLTQRAAARYIVEGAKAIAFLVAFAEDATPSGKRPGPPPDAFSPRLLEGLATAHFEAFGIWPALSRAVSDERDGPSNYWLAEVLRLAAERLTFPNLARVNQRAFPFQERLISSLDRVMANEPTTRAIAFVAAAARAKAQM